MEDYTQNYINKSLSAKKYNTLKSVVKSKTLYHELKKQKKVTLKFAADNQGSENLAYFPARISGLKGYVGVYINMKSVILHEYKLIKITRF
ncbi:hypothetical protein NBRC111893_691 [Lentilactobacillus kosonis]|uniref:Uncharacterized protein n=2 Tax=Lentilactobacillus kosonis TaxID=2810561 RepID=A0A401FJH5_9LACO|nr:hypothetical protein NBRC111893_691 [Lentilactobacillus kosonis]